MRANKRGRSHHSRGSALSVVALSLAAVAALLVLVGTFTLPGGRSTEAAAVGFGSASNCTPSSNGRIPSTWTHTVTAGQTLLVVGIVNSVDNGASRVPTAVTYNGDPLTLLSTSAELGATSHRTSGTA